MGKLKEQLQALSKWLNDKPYTKAMYVNAFAAIIMAVMSVIMIITIFQNRESIKFTKRSLAQTDESLRLTKDEFRLLNRPLLICTGPRFGGETTGSEGGVWPRSITLDIRNLTKIPATNVSATSEMSFDGKKTKGANLNLGVIVGDRDVCTDIILTEKMYSAAVDEARSFEIDIKFTYSGMLGEDIDQYSTIIRASYRPKQKRFDYTFLDIR